MRVTGYLVIEPWFNDGGVVVKASLEKTVKRPPQNLDDNARAIWIELEVSPDLWNIPVVQGVVGAPDAPVRILALEAGPSDG